MGKTARRQWLVKAAIGAIVIAMTGSGTAAAAQAPCASGSASGRVAVRIVGLVSDGRLVCFSELVPQFARAIGTLSGLASPDTALIGIDFRVQDGRLYGVGNGGGVYTIDVATAEATFVNALTVPLEGTSFGVDFNPVADRLRIVSDTGQNLRHNVNAGGVTITDAALNYVAGTPALGIAGAGYTNNDLDPNTATTLFDADPNLDQVAIQSPPNNGSLVATGKFGIDAGPAAGFDVYSYVQGGASAVNRAFGAFKVGNTTSLYRISLLTGKAALAGRFRADVVDIAVPLNQ